MRSLSPMGQKIEKAIVVGASSGMGASLARELAAAGATVALVARRDDELQKVAQGISTGWGEGKAKTYEHDVTKFDEVPGLFERICADLGGCDLICYAAGVMNVPAEDEFSFDKDSPVIAVNLTGAVAWLNQAAVLFQKQGRGVIVGISSIAGDRGRRGFPAYHAAKAGLSTFLESLRNRLTQHGVQVTTIKPGFIDTSMTRGMEGLFWLKTPDEAARMIMSAVRKGKQTSYVPGRWRLVAMVIRSIPSFIFRRMSI
ncbi:MAG: short-chain dehydrogenase [Planctomycetes bacterium]|nr:short-chain dehydrogenase [Planctomycetota bacterium]MDP6424328.1 SDR family NAD(P)-dependent oxidoreductase [Planctomycetota bacterium]